MFKAWRRIINKVWQYLNIDRKITCTWRYQQSQYFESKQCVIKWHKQPFQVVKSLEYFLCIWWFLLNISYRLCLTGITCLLQTVYGYLHRFATCTNSSQLEFWKYQVRLNNEKKMINISIKRFIQDCFK